MPAVSAPSCLLPAGYELPSVHLGRYRKELPGEFKRQVLLRFQFGFCEKHFCSAKHQQDAEPIKDPVNPGHQGDARADHHPAHHHRAHHAPEENPVPVLPRDAEPGKNQADYEQVVE